MSLNGDQSSGNPACRNPSDVPRWKWAVAGAASCFRLRTLHVRVALSRQPRSISIGSSLARPASIAAASFSAARMPDSTALWLPSMRGTLTRPAEQPISGAAGERQLRHRLVAAFGDRTRTIGEPLAALEGATNGRVRLEALELLKREEIGGSCNSGARRSRRRPCYLRDGRGTSRRRSSCRAASRRSAAPARAGGSPASPARALSALPITARKRSSASRLARCRVQIRSDRPARDRDPQMLFPRPGFSRPSGSSRIRTCGVIAKIARR